MELDPVVNSAKHGIPATVFTKALQHTYIKKTQGRTCKKENKIV
jgi:hypothetical protein